MYYCFCYVRYETICSDISKKKAGELVELADEVLDEGLESNPTDSGFIELKTLRDQMFAVCTCSQRPKDKAEQDDATNFSFRTPENGEKQFPFTQVYGTPMEIAALSDKVWEELHRTSDTNSNEARF